MKTDLNKYIDALKEVGNMGAGQASGVLADLTKQKVDLSMPKVDLTETSEIAGLISGEQQLVVGTYSSIKGDVSGTLLVAIPIKSAMCLADLIEGKEQGVTVSLDQTAQEKLKEIGDGLSKSYLDTVSMFLDIKVERTPERIISTFGESLADLVLLGIDQAEALLISTEFSVPNTEVKGKFIMLIAMDSTDKMIDAIKKQLGE